MNDERISQALQQLRSAEVAPPLVLDAKILSIQHKHRTPLVLYISILGSIIVIGLVGSLLMRSDDHATSAAVRPSNTAQPNISNALQAATQEFVAKTRNEIAAPDTVVDLDPRAILSMHLSDEELGKFGITRSDDSIFITMQSLVADGGKLSQSLPLSTEMRRDTTLLFQWVCRAYDAKVDTMIVTGAFGHTLDESAPVIVRPTYRGKAPGVFVSVEEVQPALLGYQLRDSLRSVAQSMMPAMDTILVDSGGYVASLPTDLGTVTSSSRKLLFLYLTDRRGVNSFLIGFVPTASVLRKLPQRFHQAVNRCYSEYKPHIPVPNRMRYENKAATRVALFKQTILAGHPFVELSDSALERFGLLKDAVTICEGQSCITLDSARSSFVNPTYRTPQIGASGSLSEYTDGIMLRRQSTSILPRQAPLPMYADAGSYVEVQVTGNRDTVIKSFSLHRIRLMGGTAEPSDWLDQYPLAKAFAYEVATKLMNEQIPIDSLGYYWVRHGNISIPVLKLLFGLRTSTEWTTSPEWNGDLRRLARIAWYLPSQRVMNALPESVRLFLQPEYEALYASIERDQSIRDVCALLANPSALGFCSLADTTIRIDGIGPIPARDHFTMFITSDEATNATIDLIDASGTVVFERSNVAIQAGSTGIPVPLDRQLQQGAYMVILTTPTSVRRSRLLIGE